ncbi:MAG: hypothetical protein BGO41_13850 [Clostridiales bacterium 38-18]|nr:MAG: hypothetical protein BGO41_13850 [Clostridiales bacterium 38-18]
MNIFTCSLTGISKYNSTSDTLFTVKYIIVATVFLLLLWALSKYLTKRQGVTIRQKNIKVIERVAISADKFLFLIELDGLYYLIGSDKNGMRLIDKREHLNLEYVKPQETQSGAFFEQLKKSIIKHESAKDQDDDRA